MNIEIWFDFACPFCYIGQKRLFTALDILKSKANITFKSYQLNPNQDNVEKNYIVELGRKYAVGTDGARKMVRRAEELGLKEGLNISFDDVIDINTFKAHCGMKYAQDNNKHLEYFDEVMEAYFVKGLNISKDDTLVAIAMKLGLNADEFREAINDEKYAKRVDKDLKDGQKLKIRTTPFLVINGRETLSGAHETLKLVNVLSKYVVENAQNVFSKEMRK